MCALSLKFSPAYFLSRRPRGFNLLARVHFAPSLPLDSRILITDRAPRWYSAKRKIEPSLYGERLPDVFPNISPRQAIENKSIVENASTQVISTEIRKTCRIECDPFLFIFNYLLKAETDSLSFCIRKYSFVINNKILPLKSLRYYMSEKISLNIQLTK